METDIAVEGFRQAEITHGVWYMRLVGELSSDLNPSINGFLCGVYSSQRLSV